MTRAPTLLLVILLGFGAVSPAFAERQYWVSISSYADPDDADRAMAEASDKLSERLAVIGASTANGYYYRIATGPYMTRDLAEDRLLSAQAAGFATAWIWSADESAFVGATFSTEDDLGFEEEYLFDDSFDDPLPTRTFQDEPPSEDEADLIKKREEVPELVEDAPEGYKLNKLRRDAFVLPPDRPPPRAMTVALPVEAPLEPADPPSQLILDLNVGEPITLNRYSESQVDMRVDGKLDEDVWGRFPGVDMFRVVDPDTGEVPRHHTLVKMFYTERGLYASFEMEQPPETLVRVFSGRDEGRLNRDNVGVTIDTSGEGRYGYWVNLALGGNQVDGTVLPERQFSGDWDGAWYGGTEVTAKGWNAEIFLPWSQLAMPQESGVRRVNAYASRKVAYLDERYAVPALPFTQPLFMSALQPLVLNQVNPKQQWSVFPYASVTQDEVEDFTDPKMGADIFWRPSTNFQVTATLNPDFGTVESDDVIVNLTAFEAFFPEKRLFFQEGIEVFNATPRAKSRGGDPTTVLNTRRIGGRPFEPDVPDDVTVPLRELGQPTELIGAVKVVGQLGKVRYGLLGAAEDEIKFDVDDINYYQDGSDYGVARFLYEDKAGNGDYRALGMMTTYAAHPVEDAAVQALDYHYQTNGGDWKVDGQLIRSDVDGTGVGSGGFVDVGYTVRRGLNLRGGISHYDDKLEINTLGFLRRNDATSVSLNANYQRSDLSWVRKAELNGWGYAEVNGDGYDTGQGVGGNLELDLLNRDKIEFDLSYSPEREEDRNSRDNGTYVIEGRHGASVLYRTDTSKRLSYHLLVNHEGEEVGGEKMLGELGVVWRPVDQINLSASAQFQRRDGWLLWQEDRNFTTFESREWRPRVNLDYFLSAKQQLRFSAQWVGIRAEEQDFYLVPQRVDELEEVAKPPGPTDDFAISRLNLQLRYRWEIAPLSELSVVYTLNGSDTVTNASFDDLFRDAYDQPVGEQLIVKLRYRLGS